MNQAWLASLGIAAAILNTIGLFPYVRDLLRGKTKPERATWWVWVVLDIVALVAQFAAGSTWSLVLTAASIVKNGTIATLSLKYGYGKLRKKDIAALFFVIVGVLLWRVTDKPLVALAIIIAIDFSGFWLTVLKTWDAPRSETLIAWQLSGLAGLCALLAVGELNFTRLIFPLYGLLANVLIIGIVIDRRQKKLRRALQ